MPKRYGKSREPAKHEVRAMQGAFGPDRQAREPPEERADSDLALEAGEGSAEAVVDAGAKGEVGVGVVALDVEPVRIGELRRIAVGGAEQRHHEAALRDRLPSELRVLHGKAHGHLYRAVVAEQLLHGGGQARWVGRERRSLFGVAEERQHAVADRLTVSVTGREQDAARGEHLVSVELSPTS